MCRRRNVIILEDGSVLITSGFLRHVHERLSALADSLDRQEASARRLVRDARRDVEVVDRNWNGPRSRKVVTSASTYLDAVEPYADAIASARPTIRKWARVALETAEQLALAEGAVAAPTGGAADTVTWCGQPDPDAVEEVRQSWRLRSRRIGAELDAATAAIAKANDAVASDIATDNAPELRAELALANLRGPDQVRHWWDRLTDGQQLALLSAYPGLLERVKGLPPRVQTQATRTLAGDELVGLETLEAAGNLTPGQARRLHELRTDLGALGFGDDRREVELVMASTTTNPHLVAVASPQDEICFAQEPVPVATFESPTR
jgi:hypothetical protein